MVFLSAAMPAVADLSNGSFESLNFNGWDVSATNGYFDVVGHLGSYDGSWDATNGNYFAWGYGATLSQTFTAVAGDTITFDYFWNMRPTPGAGVSDDVGRAVILGSGGQIVTTVFEYSPSVSTPLYLGNGWQSATPYTFTSSGSYTLRFEALLGPAGPVSFMGVDNAGLTPGVVPIPVPGAVLLGAIGLSFAGWRLKRKTV